MGVEEKEERVNMFVVYLNLIIDMVILIIAILNTLYKVEDLLDGYRDLKVRRVASRVSLFEAVESTTKEGY